MKGNRPVWVAAQPVENAEIAAPARSFNGTEIVSTGYEVRQARTQNRAHCSLQCVPGSRFATDHRDQSANRTTNPAISAKKTPVTAMAAPTRRKILGPTTQNFSPQSRHR
jgi:hypothetical protein